MAAFLAYRAYELRSWLIFKYLNHLPRLLTVGK